MLDDNVSEGVLGGTIPRCALALLPPWGNAKESKIHITESPIDHSTFIISLN